MVSIVVVGCGRDTRISTFLYKILSPQYKVALCTSEKISTPAEALDFLILDRATMPTLACQNCICIFKELSPGLGTAPCQSCDVAIVGSDNRRAMDYISKAGLSCITCGLSSKDSVTLTSISRDHAVVAIQRSLKTLTGTIVEPAEFPVTLAQPVDRYTLLCSACALAICNFAQPLPHGIL